MKPSGLDYSHWLLIHFVKHKNSCEIPLYKFECVVCCFYAMLFTILDISVLLSQVHASLKRDRDSMIQELFSTHNLGSLANGPFSDETAMRCTNRLEKKILDLEKDLQEKKVKYTLFFCHFADNLWAFWCLWCAKAYMAWYVFQLDLKLYGSFLLFPLRLLRSNFDLLHFFN